MDEINDRNFKVCITKSKYIMETATAVFNSQDTTLCDIRMHFKDCDSAAYNKMYKDAENEFNKKTEEAFQMLRELIDDYIFGVVTTVENIVTSDSYKKNLDKIDESLKGKNIMVHYFDNHKLYKEFRLLMLNYYNWIADALDKQYPSIQDYTNEINRIDTLVENSWKTINLRIKNEKKNTEMIGETSQYFNNDLISFGTSLQAVRKMADTFKSNLYIASTNLRNPNKAFVILITSMKMTEITQECISIYRKNVIANLKYIDTIVNPKIIS